MISIKSYDLTAILIISLLKMMLLFPSVMMYLCQDRFLGAITTLSIFLLLSTIQIAVYFATLKKVRIDHVGVTVLKKSNKETILWSEIKLFYYYNEPLLLQPNTVQIFHGDDKMLLGDDHYHYSRIRLSLKKYKEAIKLIPSEILENNKLFLYPSTELYEWDKYHLYEK